MQMLAAKLKQKGIVVDLDPPDYPAPAPPGPGADALEESADEGDFSSGDSSEKGSDSSADPLSKPGRTTNGSAKRTPLGDTLGQTSSVLATLLGPSEVARNARARLAHLIRVRRAPGRARPRGGRGRVATARRRQRRCGGDGGTAAAADPGRRAEAQAALLKELAKCVASKFAAMQERLDETEHASDNAKAQKAAQTMFAKIDQVRERSRLWSV
jgi:hypothetical protein